MQPWDSHDQGCAVVQRNSLASRHEYLKRFHPERGRRRGPNRSPNTCFGQQRVTFTARSCKRRSASRGESGDVYITAGQVGPIANQPCLRMDRAVNPRYRRWRVPSPVHRLSDDTTTLYRECTHSVPVGRRSCEYQGLADQTSVLGGRFVAGRHVGPVPRRTHPAGAHSRMVGYRMSHTCTGPASWAAGTSTLRKS